MGDNSLWSDCIVFNQTSIANIIAPLSHFDAKGALTFYFLLHFYMMFLFRNTLNHTSLTCVIPYWFIIDLIMSAGSYTFNKIASG